MVWIEARSIFLSVFGTLPWVLEAPNDLRVPRHNGFRQRGRDPKVKSKLGRRTDLTCHCRHVVSQKADLTPCVCNSANGRQWKIPKAVPAVCRCSSHQR